MHTELIALMAIPLLLVLRIILLLPVRQPSDARSTAGKKRRADERCSLGVFLGSGGHTAEMCTLLSSTDFARYSPRTYIFCPGDEHSLRLVRELERSKAGGDSSEASYSFLPLPRARKVKQPFLSTVFTSIGTLLVAIASLFVLPLLRNPLRPGFEVLLVNGPGTCVLVVAVCWIRRVLGLPYTRIIYVESFARVTSLSLSAKLLRPFVDTFVVQWPQVANGGSEHASVEGKSWPDDGTAKVTSSRQKGRTGWRDWLRGRTVYKGWLV